MPGVRHVPIPAKQAARAGFDARPFLPPGIEVVHAHQEIADPGVPWLWTMHGNAREGHTLPANTIGLSADHARRHQLTHWVHNGLDPAELVFLPRKKDYDLFLGRLHSVKGWQWAVEAARRTERKVVIAGGWRPVVSRWVRFAGTVDGERKTALLSEARILWAPAQWDEPFGLTSIEALASGTPVLGTRRGALPEIVTPETGACAESAGGADRADSARGAMRSGGMQGTGGAEISLPGDGGAIRGDLSGWSVRRSGHSGVSEE